MRNKILIPIFVVAIAAVAGWNISQSKSDATLSDVALANVEALANGEGGGATFYCCGNCCTCAKSADGSIIVHGHLHTSPC